MVRILVKSMVDIFFNARFVVGKLSKWHTNKILPKKKVALNTFGFAYDVSCNL
jgi:hypothetical protein